MRQKRRFALAAQSAALITAVLLYGAHADPADEVKRLAIAMDWKAGSIVADIGAGDGQYAFAAAKVVGPSGKVFATELDPQKLTSLREQAAKRRLGNVIVLDSKDADTNLPAECCNAIFLRRVYHHLTKPAEFDAALLRSLKAGGRLAIIDFPPRAGLERVEGIPANRGGHGIPQQILIDELTSAGFQLVKTVSDWPAGDYCVLFVKR